MFWIWNNQKQNEDAGSTFFVLSDLFFKYKTSTFSRCNALTNHLKSKSTDGNQSRSGLGKKVVFARVLTIFQRVANFCTWPRTCLSRITCCYGSWAGLGLLSRCCWSNGHIVHLFRHAEWARYSVRWFILFSPLCSNLRCVCKRERWLFIVPYLYP